MEPLRSSHPEDGLAPAGAFGGFVAESDRSQSCELLPLPTWDRYQISAFLGAVALGTVYRARDLRLKR